MIIYHWRRLRFAASDGQETPLYLLIVPYLLLLDYEPLKKRATDFDGK